MNSRRRVVHGTLEHVIVCTWESPFHGLWLGACLWVEVFLYKCQLQFSIVAETVMSYTLFYFCLPGGRYLMRTGKVETVIQCYRMSCVIVRRIFWSWKFNSQSWTLVRTVMVVGVIVIILHLLIINCVWVMTFGKEWVLLNLAGRVGLICIIVGSRAMFDGGFVDDVIPVFTVCSTGVFVLWYLLGFGGGGPSKTLGMGSGVVGYSSFLTNWQFPKVGGA